jgi:CheY-like chemotaxis protein
MFMDGALLRPEEGAVMVAQAPDDGHAAAPEPRPLVLCVDDEKPILAALARILRHEPYEVVTTDDPEEALDRIRSHPVSLILCDYRMPVISGTSLLQMVKAHSPATVRVMLTGYPQDGWLRAAEENGLMRVCTKPWDDVALRRLIREEIDSIAGRPFPKPGGDASPP